MLLNDYCTLWRLRRSQFIVRQPHLLSPLLSIVLIVGHCGWCSLMLTWLFVFFLSIGATWYRHAAGFKKMKWKQGLFPPDLQFWKSIQFMWRTVKWVVYCICTVNGVVWQSTWMWSNAFESLENCRGPGLLCEIKEIIYCLILCIKNIIEYLLTTVCLVLVMKHHLKLRMSGNIEIINW